MLTLVGWGLVGGAAGAVGVALGVREGKRYGGSLAGHTAWWMGGGAVAGVAATMTAGAAGAAQATLCAVCVLCGAVAAVSDMASRAIRVAVNVSAFGAVGICVAGAVAAGGSSSDALAAAVAGASWGITMEVLSLWKPDAVGGGDARVGAWTVMAAVWSIGVFGGFAALAATHAVAACVGLAQRRRSVPFGVWLAGFAIACSVAPGVASS